MFENACVCVYMINAKFLEVVTFGCPKTLILSSRGIQGHLVFRRSQNSAVLCRRSSASAFFKL